MIQEMTMLDVADNTVTAVAERASSAYVPPLQRTQGQPPPIAAHGGLSYMSFDRNGDAGTALRVDVDPLGHLLVVEQAPGGRSVGNGHGPMLAADPPPCTGRGALQPASVLTW